MDSAFKKMSTADQWLLVDSINSRMREIDGLIGLWNIDLANGTLSEDGKWLMEKYHDQYQRLERLKREVEFFAKS